MALLITEKPINPMVRYSLWLLTTGAAIGLNVAMAATGSAILKQAYPNSYDIAKVSAATAVGSSIMNGFFLVVAAYHLWDAPAGEKRALTTSEIFGHATASVTTAIVSSMLGFGLVGAGSMRLRSTAAASAMGGAVVGMACALSCAGANAMIDETPAQLPNENTYLAY